MIWPFNVIASNYARKEAARKLSLQLIAEFEIKFLDFLTDNSKLENLGLSDPQRDTLTALIRGNKLGMRESYEERISRGNIISPSAVDIIPSEQHAKGQEFQWARLDEDTDELMSAYMEVNWLRRENRPYSVHISSDVSLLAKIVGDTHKLENDIDAHTGIRTFGAELYFAFTQHPVSEVVDVAKLLVHRPGGAFWKDSNFKDRIRVTYEDDIDNWFYLGNIKQPLVVNPKNAYHVYARNMRERTFGDRVAEIGRAGIA